MSLAKITVSINWIISPIESLIEKLFYRGLCLFEAKRINYFNQKRYQMLKFAIR